MSTSTKPPTVHVFLDRSRAEILGAATGALVEARVPHYAGIGSTAAGAAALLANPGLDVVLSDQRLDQPHYG